MNEIAQRDRGTTQAADGVPRLRWTLSEFERLTELGIFGEQDHIELVGGELIPMSPEGQRHEVVRSALLNFLRRCLPAACDLNVEPGWRLSNSDYVEPDFMICAAGSDPTSISPINVMLVIEVAHSSLKLDNTLKAATYAKHGVQDYWVVNAATLSTRVHRLPSQTGYDSVAEFDASTPLTPAFSPAFSLRLAELTLA